MPFKDLDIFPKMREDYTKRRNNSGALTIFCLGLMAYMFVSSFVSYLATPPKQRLRVDETPFPTKDGALDFERLPRVPIHFDVFLPSLPCPFVNFGVMDTFKEFYDDAFARVKMHRIDRNGNKIKTDFSNLSPASECGSCYGAASGCCNTCKDVRRAFKAKNRVPPPLHTIEQCKGKDVEYQRIKDEHCRIHGTVSVPPISGVFFIAPGDSYGARSQHIADYLAMNLTVDDFNMTHRIDKFFVGDQDPGDRVLDGVTKVQERHGRMKALYYVRVVREKRSAGELYRASVTHYERYREGESAKFPGIFFSYDVSPIVVEYKRDTTFLRFLVDLMSIMGGIFSIGVLIDHTIKQDEPERITGESLGSE